MNQKNHIFAVGIESYQDTSLCRVAYAENDAYDFIKAWQALGARPTNCVCLLGVQATKTAVDLALQKFLGNVGEGDTIVFFFAGCGVSKAGASYFLTHDSQLSEIEQTGIAVSDFLKRIASSKNKRTILFIDFGSAAVSNEILNLGLQNFSSQKIADFCKIAPERVAFLASDERAISLPSALHKHGIWTQCLLQALSGEASEAIVDGDLISKKSLQDYVIAELPRIHRATQMGTGGQTPLCFGSDDSTFTIADLSEIFAKKAAEINELGSALQEAIFFGKKLGEVRRLSGFQKGHRVPDSNSTFSKNFVRQVGHDDVKKAAEQIHKGLRAAFQYKRKDINFSSEEGYATIKTPDFDVFISIEQDAKQAAQYVFYTEIANIRRAAVVMELGFSELFTSFCDTIVVRFLRQFNLEDKIDEIENIPELEPYLTYEADCSAFTLELPEPSIHITVTANQMTLCLPSTRNLNALLNNSQSALASLRGSGISIILPKNASL